MEDNIGYRLNHSKQKKRNEIRPILQDIQRFHKVDDDGPQEIAKGKEQGKKEVQ